MYVFTNTITTLFDYHVKLVIYSDNGLTGTTTATNGGYIQSLSPTGEEIDPFTGEFRPGGLSIEFLNVGNIISDYVFGGAITAMEARLWISYDSGTTWECIFFGKVLFEGLTRVDADATETRNRRYSVSCEHAILSLKEVEIDTDPDAGTNVPSTGIVTPGVTIFDYATDSNGNPFIWPSGSSNTHEFISLDGILQYIYSNVQFISGATAPTLSYDSSAMQHSGESIGSGTFGFDELYMLFQRPGSAIVEGFFSYASGKYGAYALSNLQEMSRLFMDSLFMIPIMDLTESGGAFSLDVSFQPRIRAAADLDAVAGTIPMTVTRSMSVQEWLDGYQVITTGLSENSYSPISYGGRTFEVKNHLMTGPYFSSLARYVFVMTYIVPSVAGVDTTQHLGPSAQMLYGISGGSVYTIHRFKHLTSQSYFGNALTGGYYGVHGSVFDILAGNLDPRVRSSVYGSRGYEISCHGLATNNSGTKSVKDLRLLKKIVIDGVTCMIVSISRDVANNTTQIKAIEVT